MDTTTVGIMDLPWDRALYCTPTYWAFYVPNIEGGHHLKRIIVVIALMPAKGPITPFKGYACTAHAAVTSSTIEQTLSFGFHSPSPEGSWRLCVAAASKILATLASVPLNRFSNFLAAASIAAIKAQIPNSASSV